MKLIEDFQDGVADTEEGKRFCECLEVMIRKAMLVGEKIVQPDRAA